MDIERIKKRHKEDLDTAKKLIDEARQKALRREEVEALLQEQKLLQEQVNAGEISPETYAERFEALDDRIGGVWCDSIMELKSALEIAGMTPEAVQTWVAHENAHANKAQQLRVPIRYRIMFSYQENDGKRVISMMPAVQHMTPHAMSEEKRAALQREIIEAPDELSDHDKEDLSRLDKEER